MLYMHIMRRTFALSAGVLCVVVLLVLTSGAALAEGTRGNPVRTQTLSAGPYAVDVNIYSQPYTGTPFDITVVPHNTGLRLSGQVFAIPSSEIDATKLRTILSPDASQPWILAGSIHLPVRGAWTLLFNLSGPQGAGSTSFIVDVAAPGAMPTWLAWLIGLIPVVAIAAWFLIQHRYRRTLVQKQGQLQSQGI